MKFIFSVSILVFWFPIFAQAQEEPNIPIPDIEQFMLKPPDEIGAKVFNLKKNQQAPESGILFNGAAALWLDAEFVRIQERWKIEYEASLSQQRSWYKKQIRDLQAEHNSDKREFELIVKSKDETIKDLQSINRQATKPKSKLLVALQWTGVVVGSLAVGALVGWGAASL